MRVKLSVLFTDMGDPKRLSLIDHLIKDRDASDTLNTRVSTIYLEGKVYPSNPYMIYYKERLESAYPRIEVIPVDTREVIDGKLPINYIFPLENQSSIEKGLNLSKRIGNLHRKDKYWIPISSISRVLTSVESYGTPSIYRELGIANPDGTVESDESLGLIPGLTNIGFSLNLEPIKDEELFNYRVTQLLKELLPYASNGLVIKSTVPDIFPSRILLPKGAYHEGGFLRNCTCMIDDITDYLKMLVNLHGSNDNTVIIQPYYKGVENIIDCYIDDAGNTHCSRLVMNEGSVIPAPIHHNIPTIVSSISDRYKLKVFHLKLIELDRGPVPFGLVDLRPSVSEYIGSVSKYFYDCITYEMNRTFSPHTERVGVLTNKQYSFRSDLNPNNYLNY